MATAATADRLATLVLMVQKVAASMNIDLRWVASCHESAHAIAALHLGDPVYSLVVRDNGSGEFHSYAPRLAIPLENQQHVLSVICDSWRSEGGPADREWLERQITVLLAGPQANVRLLRGTRGCGHDFNYVDLLISTLPPEEQQRSNIYANCEEHARHIVWQRWADIGRLAERLYREGELFEPAIRDTLRGSGPRGRRLIGEEVVCN